jgi:hypothetical protein
MAPAVLSKFRTLTCICYFSSSVCRSAAALKMSAPSQFYRPFPNFSEIGIDGSVTEDNLNFLKEKYKSVLYIATDTSGDSG